MLAEILAGQVLAFPRTLPPSPTKLVQSLQLRLVRSADMLQVERLQFLSSSVGN